MTFPSRLDQFFNKRARRVQEPVFEVSYKDVEALIKTHFNCPVDYLLPAFHNEFITNGKMIMVFADREEFQDYDEWLRIDAPPNVLEDDVSDIDQLSDCLTDLCNRGVIVSGTYIIHICW